MSLNTIVALEIGSSTIRAIEATLKKGRIVKLTNIAVASLPTQVVQQGTVISEANLYRAVRQIWKTNKIKTKNVIVTINGQSIITRLKDNLPEQKNQTLFDLMLKTQMADTILSGVQNYYLSGTILDKYYDPNKRAVLCETLVVGIEKKNLDTIVRALENAGLRVLGAEIAPLALARSVLQTPEDMTKRYASIDIGGDLTTIIIHKEGFPEYIRTITGISGNSINQRISEEMGFNTKRAEEEKFKALGEETRIATVSTNIFSKNETVSGLTPGSEEAKKAEFINSIVSQEITLSIRNIKETLTDAITFSEIIDSPIEEIKLSGGGANINTLLSRMENELGIKTTYVEPFKNVKMTSKAKKQLKTIGHSDHEFSTVFGTIFGGRF
jgi:type IV pilus assembly protein PilM